MRTLIVYESIYGSTHQAAEAVAAGLMSAGAQVSVIPVSSARHESLSSYQLLAVGGPTHAHGMSRRSTRRQAVDTATRAGQLAALEPGAGGIGLREWLDGLGLCRGYAAAFDTRLPGPALIAGRASQGIASRLKLHGFLVVSEPKSFLVDADNKLLDGQAAEAQNWGVALAADLAAAEGTPKHIPDGDSRHRHQTDF